MLEFRRRVVPVLVLNDLDTGLKMCEVLIENNLPLAEITFRTPVAADIIRAAVKEFPQLQIGAGTILSVTDLERAIDAGARFAVAPGFNPTVVKAAAARHFDFVPGCCTPSEIEQAMELGCRFLKFFPAEASGGAAMLKALLAPYRHLGIQFMPTGGVSVANAADYLAVPGVAAVGGTWLGKAIPDWAQVASAVREAGRF